MLRVCDKPSGSSSYNSPLMFRAPRASQALVRSAGSTGDGAEAPSSLRAPSSPRARLPVPAALPCRPPRSSAPVAAGASEVRLFQKDGAAVGRDKIGLFAILGSAGKPECLDSASPLWLLPHPDLLVLGVAVSCWRLSTAQTTALPEPSLFLLASRPAALPLSSWVSKPQLLSLVGRRHPLLSLLPLLPPTACFQIERIFKRCFKIFLKHVPTQRKVANNKQYTEVPSTV